MEDQPPGAATVAPYGSWSTTLSADRVGGSSLKLGQTAIVGNAIFWTEGRPQEQGRNVLMRADADGTLHELTAAPLNVRSRVHEYGGGAFLVDGETVFFCNFDDQRLYAQAASGTAAGLATTSGMRYADAVMDRRCNRLIAVREDHASGAAEPVNALVSIDLANGAEQVLVGGHDFFASPRLSPDGRRLAWLTWDHPNMPWDGTELWLADVDGEGALGKPRKVAGGRAESVCQPVWSPAGELHFVSDRTGWWNLYKERASQVDDGDAGRSRHEADPTGMAGFEIEAVCPMAAEFAEPQWAFAMSSYGFDGRGRIVCTYVQGGVSRLAVIDMASGLYKAGSTGRTGSTGSNDSTGHVGSTGNVGEPSNRLQPIETGFTAIRDLKVGANQVAFFGGAVDAPEALIRLDLTSSHATVIRTSGDSPEHAADVSRPESITYPSAGGREAHAFFYAPRNRSFVGPPNELPPLLVIDHGGPTGATNATFRWAIQYWTQRGFALVDVNYGGSSGFGRAYRERLDGQWGIVDVEDSIAAAQFLVARGDVDPARIAIRGASAGGYTTLAALTFHDFFAAGASHYGIGDLEALAKDTHKFESRYLDGLVGPYPAAKALYHERSPVHHTERLSSALLLLQGAEDKVVPPAQAEAMYAAIRAKGLPVAYLLFEHEQHGFRRAENIRRALEAELFFYGRVLGFEPADAIEPIDIANLP